MRGFKDVFPCTFNPRGGNALSEGHKIIGEKGARLSYLELVIFNCVPKTKPCYEVALSKVHKGTHILFP